MENGKWRGKNARSILEYIHKHKTAKMIEVPLVAGAVIARAPSKKIEKIASFGGKIGMAFQILDDVLDAIGDSKKLGKTCSDEENEKLTYPALYGIEKSKNKAAVLVKSAKKDLEAFGSKADALRAIADFVISRDH
jgi:geranylgeranyl diphosphate synthase type II